MSKFTKEDFERAAKELEGFLYVRKPGAEPGAELQLAALRTRIRAMDREKIAQVLYERGHSGGAWLSWQEIPAISKENWQMIADAIIAMLTEDTDARS